MIQQRLAQAEVGRFALHRVVEEERIVWLQPLEGRKQVQPGVPIADAPNRDTPASRLFGARACNFLEEASLRGVRIGVVTEKAEPCIQSM